jgi:hypothetical protein
MSCATEDNNSDVNSEDENVEEPVEVLNFINSQKIADTPVDFFDSQIVYENKLFSLRDKDTYVFDFELVTWTLLETNAENVFPTNGFNGEAINFIRNSKWNMFTERGLFEFDFELNNWAAIKVFPSLNGLFSTSGFYLEEDLAIYFIDHSNGNNTIYKFDLVTNELLNHGEYVNVGNRGITNNGSLVINNSYYYLRPVVATGASVGRTDGILISKFNEDFTSLNTINQLKVDNFVSDGVAMSYKDDIIFGLGGDLSIDTNGLVKDVSATFKFFTYNTINDSFTEMATPFYEYCGRADIIVYNDEFYLINGITIKNNKTEFRKKIEKLEFDFITQ